MSKRENEGRDREKAVAAALPEELDPTPKGLARTIRWMLIALVLATTAALCINDLNSYDTWTHLAIGRLMWEEERIPDSEPFSYTQNREMSLDEAAPRYVVRESVFDGRGRLVVSAGAYWDNACREKIAAAGVQVASVRTRLDPPVRRLSADAKKPDGSVVLASGTLLRDAEIDTLKAAGVQRVETTVPWVNHEWLFQIPAYLSYQWLGMPGPTIYKTVILMAGFLVLLLMVYRRETHVIGVAAVFLAAIVSYKRFFMRPEVFSILFTAMWLWLLERHRHKPGWAICVWMPLLMIVWINTHGYFILGVALPIIYLIGEGLQSIVPMPGSWTSKLLWKTDLISGRAWKQLGIATLLTVGATFVNPYGIDGARYPIDVLGQVADPTSVIRTVIGEMQPPWNFGFTYAVFYTIVLIIVSGLAFVLNVRRMKLSRLLLWVVSLIFMTKALRNMPFFGVPAAAFLALCVNEAWDDTVGFLRERMVPGVLVGVKWAAQIGLAALLIHFALLNVSDRFYVNDVSSQRCGFGYSEDKFSMGAVEWVRDHKVEGPLFDAFGMGGLCMWKLFPEDRLGPDGQMHTYYGGRRLFIDGRAELYGGRFVKDYTRALSDPNFWRGVDAQYRFGVVFLNWQAADTQPLMRTLYEDPEWALVYGDGTGYVFVRNTEANKAVIQAARRSLEAPQFVDLAKPYGALAAALPGAPSPAEFAAQEARIQSLSRILCADPRLGNEARLASATPFEVAFDRRAMDNRYDRVRRVLPFLPERAIAPGEEIGQSGFALINGYPDLSEAILLGLARNVSSNVPDVMVNLANLYQQRGEMILRSGGDTNAAKANLQYALEYYRRAEILMPDYPGLCLQLLRLYDLTGDGEMTDRYLRICTRWWNVWPNVNTTTMIANIYMRRNRVVEALRQYESTLGMLPESEAGPIYERLAYCHLRLRDARRALSEAQRAVDLDSSEAQPWYTYGYSLEYNGRRDEAVAAYRNALKIDPNFKLAQDRLQAILNPPPPARPTPAPSPFGGFR